MLGAVLRNLNQLVGRSRRGGGDSPPGTQMAEKLRRGDVAERERREYARYLDEEVFPRLHREHLDEGN